MDRNRLRKRWVAAVGTLGGVVLIVVMVVLATHSLEANDAYSSIVAALVALGTVFTGVVMWLRHEDPPPPVDEAAEALAHELLEQWEPEARHRRQRFGAARTIPLSWSETERDVADSPEGVVGAGPLGAVTLKLDGSLEGNPEQAARRIAKAFNRLPIRRLVMLGDPGAGKTFLAITLTVGLLRERRSNDPVPVFLSLSSWDPVATTLDDWIVHDLAHAHYGGRARTPRALLSRGLLLPVLDGLDELPEHLRRQAISRVNDTLAEGDRPLVLTCRSAEYEDGIVGGAPVLLRAPVVEVHPVPLADVVDQLKAELRRDDVVRYVEEHPDGPLSTALSTPLMLSLFIAAHRERDPAELLDRDRFTSRHAVEDHLVDLLVDTVYPARAADGSGAQSPWTSAEARSWLTYLARYLHRHGERDFAWWKLAQRVLSPWVASALGLLVGFLVYVLATLVLAGDPYAVGSRNEPVWVLLGSPPLLGTVFGVVVASLWLAGARRTPRWTASDREHGGNFGRGVLTGVLLVLVPGVPLLLALSIGSLHTYQGVVRTTAMGGALLALSLVSGLAVGLHELLVIRSDRTARVSPEELLRQDRRSTWSAVATTSLVIATSSVLAATLAAASGAHIGQRIAVARGLPTVADPRLPPLPTHVPWPLTGDGLPALVKISVVLAVLFAVAVLTTRAWTRFLVARVVLAGAGRLPLQTMRFLADARKQGLLRGAGASYQFWHARLQERLVATAADRDRRIRRPRWQAAAAAFVLVMAVVVTVWLHEPEDCRPTGWSSVDARMQRVVMGDASGCVVTLWGDEWRFLETGPADVPLLDAISGVRDVPWERSAHVYVHGELDRLSSPTWNRALRGVVAAQEVSDRPIIIEFTHSDVERVDAADVNRLRAFYVASSLASASATGIQAISLDQAESWLDVKFSVPQLDLGIRDDDLTSRSSEYRDDVTEDWLNRIYPVRTLPSDVLLDGMDDEECSALSEASEVRVERFDLRGVRSLGERLGRISECGRATVLVDPGRAVELRDLDDHLSSRVRPMYLRDESSSIEPDCQARLGEDAHAEAVAACVAVVSAAENFRIDVVDVDTE